MNVDVEILLSSGKKMHCTLGLDSEGAEAVCAIVEKAKTEFTGNQHDKVAMVSIEIYPCPSCNTSYGSSCICTCKDEEKIENEEQEEHMVVELPRRLN